MTFWYEESNGSYSLLLLPASSFRPWCGPKLVKGFGLRSWQEVWGFCTLWASKNKAYSLMTVDVFQTLRLYCHPTKQNCINQKKKKKAKLLRFFHFYMTTLLDPLLQPHYVIPWKKPPQGLYFPTSFSICHMCPFAKALVSQTEAYTCIWILEREGKEQKKEIEKWWGPKGQHIHCSALQHRASNTVALALIQCCVGLGKEL